MIRSDFWLESFNQPNFLAYSKDLVNSRNGIIEEYEKEKTADNYQIEHSYSKTTTVKRVKKKGKKRTYPYQNNQKGLGERDNWKPYNGGSLAFAKDKFILWHEGEKACDYAVNTGLASISIVGAGVNCQTITDNTLKALVTADCKGIIYLADNDTTGRRKAKSTEKLVKNSKFSLPFFHLSFKEILHNCPEKADFEEYFYSFKEEERTAYFIQADLELALHMEAEKLRNREIEKELKIEKQAKTELELKDGTKQLNASIPILEPWFEVCYKELFGNQETIADLDSIYSYENNYYQLIQKGSLRRKIHEWVNSELVFDPKSGVYKKPYAKPENVLKAYNWALHKCWESPEKINQGGLPLSNGILNINESEKGEIKINLEPHSPDKIFTFCSEVKYNPKADPKYALELLECLEEPYRNLFLKTIATILGMDIVRKKWDRVKALILKGEGQNGKDTLREVISLLLGKTGITGCTLNHFKQADEGRSFSLARLAINPKINWASENKGLHLDAIQSLKQAITGDPLYLESKGKDGYDAELNTLFIFNTNEDPSMAGNTKAIQSRFVVIPFTKVYSQDPKAGELKANPNFKHDSQFLIEHVCPSFLNLLIEKYKEVLKTGIDYNSETNSYSEEIMERANHLKRFCKEIKLEFTGNKEDSISFKSILVKLHHWYVEEGLLEYDQYIPSKKIWLEDEDYKFDKLVKVAHQLPKRLEKIFPKSSSVKTRDGKFLVGVKIMDSTTENEIHIGDVREVERDGKYLYVEVLAIKENNIYCNWSHNNLEVVLKKEELGYKVYNKQE